MSIKKNDIYQVKVTDSGFKGEGIAKIDDLVVFIPGAIKDEVVKIKILKVLTTHAFAKIEEIINPSKLRRKDECEIYEKCGGCALRHIEYEETLKIKRQSVETTLKKQGIELQVNEIIGMDKPLFYRNKLQYPIGKGIDNKPVMGIFAERTHRIVPTESCFIQNERLQEIANGIFSFIKNNKIPVYDEINLSGEIRHLVLRIGIKTDEVMVTIVTNKKKINKEKDLVKYIIESFPDVKTIIKNINDFNTNVILGEKNEILYGDGYIHDELLGFSFKISPMSFYQVNPVQTEKLYYKAIECANLTGNETVFDLYCGIGTIGICASKKVKKLYGMETIPEAIEDAKENAIKNNIENAEFFVGDVENTLPKFIEENNIKPDVIFIDPPRKGCEKQVVNTILEVEPNRIVYVSCNPATLARDLKMFAEKYEIKEVTPVDMFPYTSHVECVTYMELKNKKDV